METVQDAKAEEVAPGKQRTFQAPSVPPAIAGDALGEAHRRGWRWASGQPVLADKAVLQLPCTARINPRTKLARPSKSSFGSDRFTHFQHAFKARNWAIHG